MGTSFRLYIMSFDKIGKCSDNFKSSKEIRDLSEMRRLNLVNKANALIGHTISYPQRTYDETDFNLDDDINDELAIIDDFEFDEFDSESDHKNPKTSLDVYKHKSNKEVNFIRSKKGKELCREGATLRDGSMPAHERRLKYLQRLSEKPEVNF